MRPRKNEATRSRTHSGEPQGSLFLYAAPAGPGALCPASLAPSSPYVPVRLASSLGPAGHTACRPATAKRPDLDIYLISPRDHLLFSCCLSRAVGQGCRRRKDFRSASAPTARGDPTSSRDGPDGPFFLRGIFQSCRPGIPSAVEGYPGPRKDNAGSRVKPGTTERETERKSIKFTHIQNL